MDTAIQEILTRLQRIEESLSTLMEERPAKEWYTTSEIGKLLSRSPWTVREWCRLKRIHAEKRESGRGEYSEWMVSREELIRVSNEGLLPLPK